MLIAEVMCTMFGAVFTILGVLATISFWTMGKPPLAGLGLLAFGLVLDYVAVSTMSKHAATAPSSFHSH